MIKEMLWPAMVFASSSLISVRAHLNYTTWKHLAGHKLKDTDESYIRTTEEDRLAEFVKAIDLLTIDPTQRLQEKVQELKGQQAQEIAMLKERLKSYDKTLAAHEEYYQKIQKITTDTLIKVELDEAKFKARTLDRARARALDRNMVRS